MAIVYILFGILLGYFLFDKERVALTKLHKRLASPVSSKLELDWTIRQFFLLVSKSMSERWYEARAHLHMSVLKSLMCTFYLIDIYCIEIMDDTKTTIHPHIVLIPFWERSTSKETLWALIVNYVQKVRGDRTEERGVYYYQLFKAGSNVIDYCMSSRSYFDKNNGE